MIDPFKPNLYEHALLNTYTQEEKARRSSMDRNKDFYYNKHDKYVETFSIEAKPVTLFISRPILKKRTSMLYRNKLVREITGPSASVAFLENLYSDNDIDNIYLQADLLSELTGTALLSMVADEDKQSGYRITLWDGANISAVPDGDDVSQLAALSLVKEINTLSKGSKEDQINVETVTHQQIWTKDIIAYYDGYTKRSILDNELGFIPFSVIKGEEVANQFYGFSPATSVSLMNLSINQMLSDLAYTIKLQAANPIALSGFQGGEQLTIQPGKAINLPAGAEAKVLQMNPQIQDVLDSIRYLEQKLYETSSVPEVSIVGSEGTSGRELLVRWYPLLQVFEEKAIRFHKYELDSANNFLRIAGLEPIESIAINYDKTNLLPFDPSDDTREEDIKLNLTNPAELLRKDKPNLTEQESLSIIKDNEVINKGLEGRPKGE